MYFKAILLSVFLLFSGCSHYHLTTITKDLSRFGIKKTYTIDLERDLNIIKKALKKVYKYQSYLSDSSKTRAFSPDYERADYHENIAPYIDFLEKVGQKHGIDEFVKLATDANLNLANFVYKPSKKSRIVWVNGQTYTSTWDGELTPTNRKIDKENGYWWATGDCESTYLAIETYLIRDGINPQRIFEVYADVMDDNFKTPLGGHMFGFYIGADGKTYTLEQIPYWNTMGYLHNNEHYVFNSIRRADQGVGMFRKIPKKTLNALNNDLLIKFHPTNETTTNSHPFVAKMPKRIKHGVVIGGVPLSKELRSNK